VNLISVNLSNILGTGGGALGNAGFAAEDTVASGGGARDFTGNYWGAIATDELTTKAEGANLTFLNDTLDGSGAWNLNVWPFASATVPEAPRAGGPPWAWRVRPDLSTVASIGATTFTLTYTSSMNTAIVPSVTFGLEDPYQLRIVEPNPGWISPTTWQGTHTIGTNTGDGIHTIRISGAMAADGFPIPDDTSHRFYINTRDPHVANNGLAATLGTTSIKCTWDPPAGGSTPEDRYVLQMSPENLDNFQRVPSLITGTEYTLSTLTPGTLYWFRVQRVESDGTTEDWTAPFAGCTAAVVPPSAITMTFDARALDVATGLPVPGALVTLIAETTDQGTTDADGRASLSVQALPNTAYTATVTHADFETATRQYTTAAALSDEILLTPKPPQLLVSTIYGYATSAASGLPVADAIIRAQGEGVLQTQTDPGGAYSLEVSALPNGFISMSAEAASEGLSGSAFLPAVAGSQRVDFALLSAPPVTPNNPGSTNITQTSIVWTWRDNAYNELGYEIFAGPGATAPLTSLTLTAENAQSFDYNGSTANTQHAFQTRARNAGGVSGKTSNINRYTLAATPLAPLVTNPQVNTLDVTLSAGDGNPPGTEYAIQIQPEVGGAGRVWVKGDGSVGATPVYLPASSWGTKNVNGLAESTGYTFRAQARNGDGVATALSPGAVGTTLTPAPGDPTNPGATGITQTAITWTWQDNASNEIGYEIFAGPGATAPLTSVTLTAANAESWEHTGLTTNTQYAFQTRALNAGGVSGKTSSLTRYTLAATPAAPIVTNPHANTLDVTLAAGDGNPAGTEYAIHIQPEVGSFGSGRVWVQSDGSVAAIPAWRTATEWSASGGRTTVAELKPSTLYSFTAKARNGDSVETPAGPVGQRTTANELSRSGAGAGWMLYE
jgi:hypothetical protein